MRVIIEKDYQAMSKRSAQLVAEVIRKKADAVLGLATGSTPIGLYKELVRMHEEEDLNFSQATTFNLDEYYGLAPDHPQSYHYFMYQELFKDIDIPKDKIHIPDGLAKDVDTFCAEYERKIVEAGGIDIQVLGIGRDGHIAFNEPGSSLGSRTRLKTLAKETIEDNSRFFKSIDEVPKFAITMGVATIMEAKVCLLLVNGPGKAGAVAAAIEGPITSQITASVLQMHPNAIAIMDEDAASELKSKDYYIHVEKMAKTLVK